MYENQPDRHDVNQEDDCERTGNFGAAFFGFHFGGGGSGDALFAISSDRFQAFEHSLGNRAAFDRQGMGLHGV
jgi:hypothetical protein